MRVAWQRHMLAAEPKTTQLRTMPPELVAYLDEQTEKHAARLDAALGDGPPDARARRRWHEVGWRSAPSLAAAYQEAGVEASVAFVAYHNHIDPKHVGAALRDPDSVLARALIESRRRGYTVHHLEMGQHALVTDDLPYEPLDGLEPKAARVKEPDWREELRAWLAADEPSVPLAEVLGRAGLRDDALRDATAWVTVVAEGYARGGEDVDFEIVANGAIAGVEALRPRRRRRVAGSAGRGR